MKRAQVRIGCGSGFWGDTPEGARQLITAGRLDYLVLDYLAEVTMSILAKAKQKDASLGYATDFVTQVITPHAKAIASQRIKVIVNAGGVNPRACVDAIERILAAQGVRLKVAAVLGDDLLHLEAAFRDEGVREMFTQARLPARLISANAYLGAFPIAAALDRGADIVVTGRCVDSALALGPLIHEFGWSADQHDLLSAGSLAGHVLECGAQCTGGFSTDWKETRDSWAEIGFPIAECKADGTFVVSKPEGTGGAVTVQGVSEQITYETGDPAAYVLPDVVCDWRQVHVERQGTDRVQVSGALGRPAPVDYKVSATYVDGFRCLATMLVRGMDAVPKARAVADAIFKRTRSVLQREGFGDYSETSVELLGAEEAYGDGARTGATRELVLKVAARHPDAKALDIFSREIFPTNTSTVQGLGGIFGGRPKVQPVVRLFSFLKRSADIEATVLLDGVEHAVPRARPAAADASIAPRQTPGPVDAGDSDPTARVAVVPLVSLAYARSGDKGDTSNIAVLARSESFLPVLARQLTESRVKAYLSHLVDGAVVRYDWPGLRGFNFLLHEALGGGGAASLRYDPQGKSHAQILLEFPIEVPQAWLDNETVAVA
ncbi:MAG: terpene utilization protein AtuA [Variovorax sp.]|nr:terpene utilization protein AtuA [Variovorax sp.]